MAESILRQKTVVVEISGVSNKSKDDAVTTAFKNLKSEIAKTVPELIVYMRPVEVELVDNCDSSLGFQYHNLTHQIL